MNVKSENYMDDDDDDLLTLIEDPIYLFHLIILHRIIIKNNYAWQLHIQQQCVIVYIYNF